MAGSTAAPLRAPRLERILNGDTTVEEIERVLGVVPTRDETADSVGPVLVVDDVAIRQLEEPERVDELARMLGAKKIGAEARENAASLLKGARKKR